jgi:hypothetical protein
MAWNSCAMVKKTQVEKSFLRVASARVSFEPTVLISRYTVNSTRSVLEYYDKLRGLTHNICTRN